MQLYFPITRKRRWRYSLDESRAALKLTTFKDFRLTFDFFPCKFAARSKPPSKDNHRVASYPTMQQRE